MVGRTVAKRAMTTRELYDGYNAAVAGSQRERQAGDVTSCCAPTTQNDDSLFGTTSLPLPNWATCRHS